MSMDNLKISPALEKYMTKEYRDLVERGPYGKQKKVSEMGTFKEIIEEHPMCAGCAMTLFIRLTMIGLPNPEHTILVGTAGCGRLALSQTSIPFIYGNYGDTNAVASGLKRGLEMRFPEQPKDVVVMAGDGGLADIGFSTVLHSWFRKEKFTTIMLDNEVYGNTGGQESGMTERGAILKMAPKGKKYEKMDMLGLAKTANVPYIVRMTVTNPTRVASVVRKAVLIAREIGPTFIQAYTSCNIEYAIPTPKVIDDAKSLEAERYGFQEFISDEAKAFLESIEPKKAKATKSTED